MEVIDKYTPEGKRLIETLGKIGGLEVCVGFQAGQNFEEDGVDVANVALWNEVGTSRSPSRPFMQDSVDNHEAEIQQFMRETAEEVYGGLDERAALEKVGLFQKDLMQEEIKSGSFAPNAPSTIKKKGSSKPLIDTGRMRQSVNYVIRKKGG